MSLIYISAVLCTALFVLVGIWIKHKQPERTGGELARVAEIPETGIMGVLLALLAYFLLLAKFFDPSTAGTDETSYRFVAGFAVICAMAASEVLLAAFVKKAIAYEDKLVYIRSFGANSTMRWADITQVKVSTLGRKVTFVAGANAIGVDGAKKEYLKFLKIAKAHIPAVVASDDLGKLLARLGGTGF